MEAQIIKPAEAEKFKIEKLAEAEKNKRIIEAEAKAEAIRLRAEAEAYAIEAKAKADAEQMAKKAEAWNEYKDAAMVDMILQQLPRVQCYMFSLVLSLSLLSLNILSSLSVLSLFDVSFSLSVTLPAPPIVVLFVKGPYPYCSGIAPPLL